MKKILIATLVIVTLALGFVSVVRASDWEWIDTGYDYILYDIAFPEGQSEVGFAVGSTVTYNGDGIILKTTDSGYTWEQISDPSLPGLEAAFFTDLNTGYVAGWDAYFAKTTDGGETWEEITVNAGVWYFEDLEFWDENNGIAAAWGGELYVTEDAGETWTQASGVTTGVHDLCYATESVLYAAGGDEKILKSTDGGLTWTELYAGIFTYVFLGVEFLDENYGMVAGEDGKVLMTNDGGLNWTTNNTSFYHLWHAFHIFNYDSAYVAGTPEGVYKTTDGGTTWVDDFPQSAFEEAFYKIMFTPDNNTGFICGSGGTIMRKEGIELAPAASVTPEEIFYPQTWIGETSDFPLTVANNGNAVLSVSDISSDNAVFYTDMTTFEVEPGMEQQVMVTFAPDDEGYFTGTLTIESNDPVNPAIGVALQGEGLMQQAVISVPGELIFDTTTVNNTTSLPLVVWNIGNADLEVTDVTVSGSAFGVDITSFTVVPGDSAIVMVEFMPDAQGMFEEILQVVSNDGSSPTEIGLSGYGQLGTGLFENRGNGPELTAYPNPFDGKVVISFKDPGQEARPLRIFNLLGGQVVELPAESVNHGNTYYSWNGISNSGEQVPSGIYFGVTGPSGKEKNIKIIKR